MEEYPRFWKAKTNCRLCWYHISRIFRGVAEWRPLSLTVPWITGGYFLALDVRSEDLWIKNYRGFHDFLFWIVFTTTLIILFIRGLLKPPPRLESDETAREILSSFIRTVGAIVQAKLNRFRGKIPEIRPKSDRFIKITHPVEQIGVISNATVQFLMESYGLNEDQIDITVIRRKPMKPWHFYFKHQRSWTHTPPETLMKSKAAAIQSLGTGEPIFHPDKVEAARQGLYVLSDRDKRRGPGSAFVYPASFELPSGRVDTVVSIVTYGRQFCDAHETQAVTITEAFLREFCRRFEIELCLDSIKTAD